MASLEIDVAKLFVGPNWSDTMKGHKLQLLKHQCTCHTVSIHKPSYGWPNPYPQTINFISKLPHIMYIISIGWICILATLSVWSPPSTHEVSRTVKLYYKTWVHPFFPPWNTRLSHFINEAIFFMCWNIESFPQISCAAWEKVWESCDNYCCNSWWRWILKEKKIISPYFQKRTTPTKSDTFKKPKVI